MALDISLEERKKVIKAINSFFEPRNVQGYNAKEMKKSYVKVIADLYEQLAAAGLEDETAKNKILNILKNLDSNLNFLKGNMKNETLKLKRVLLSFQPFQRLTFQGQRYFVAYLQKVALRD